jgi:hypothetical protein
VTAGFGIHQSSGPNYHIYKDPKAEIWSRIKRIDEVILHVEVRNEDTIDQAYNQAELIASNPKANILTDIFHKWVVSEIFKKISL